MPVKSRKVQLEVMRSSKHCDFEGDFEIQFEGNAGMVERDVEGNRSMLESAFEGKGSLFEQ